MRLPSPRSGMTLPLLVAALAALALSSGCGDNAKPSAHEPDAHDVSPPESPSPPVAKPVERPAPSPVVSSNPPVISHSTPPPAPPAPPSGIDPLAPPATNRPGTANLKPVEGPQTFPETVPPTEPEPVLPPGVTVLEVSPPSAKSSVRVQVDGGDQVTIETRNVQRMRIHRDRLGVSSQRSAVLRIDGQILEWMRDAEVVELNQTRNGVWAVVRTTP